MRLIIQRVTSASVVVKKKEIAAITNGLVVFVAIEKADTEKTLCTAKEKVEKMRIFEDEKEKMNFSILQVKGELLVVSQFTLFADFSKGTRPSFIHSAPFAFAKQMYDKWVEMLSGNIPTKTGIFGEYMQVHLINDGPATFFLDIN